MTFLYHVERRVAFVHVPKAGGTSIIHTLLHWDGGFRPYTQGLERGTAIIHASVREARQHLANAVNGANAQPWLVVATVRHPLRRFVSAFHQTRRMELHAYDATVAGVIAFVQEVLTPLREELTGAQWPPTSDLARFFVRQAALVEGADTVLRLEHFNADLHAFVSSCGRFEPRQVDALVPVAVLHEGPADGLRWQDLLTADAANVLEWLTHLYEADALAGGYSWPT